MPEPPRPKDAKSVEKPRRGVILTALEFFHISWLLMTNFFYTGAPDLCTKPRCIAEGIALGIALSIVHSPKIFQ